MEVAFPSAQPLLDALEAFTRSLRQSLGAAAPAALVMHRLATAESPQVQAMLDASAQLERELAACMETNADIHRICNEGAPVASARTQFQTLRARVVDLDEQFARLTHTTAVFHTAVDVVLRLPEEAQYWGPLRTQRLGGRDIELTEARRQLQEVIAMIDQSIARLTRSRREGVSKLIDHLLVIHADTLEYLAK